MPGILTRCALVGWFAVASVTELGHASSAVAPPSVDPIERRIAPVANTPVGTVPAIETCGMSCLYEKGNETLSLMALHTIERLDYLGRLANTKPSDPGFADEMKRSGVCTATELKSGITDFQTCFVRYKKLQTALLMDVRAAIQRNSARADELKGSAMMFENSTGAAAPIQGGKIGRTPTLVTLKDLEFYYKSVVYKKSATQSREYAEWLEKIQKFDFSKPPSDDLFVEYETLDRYPGTGSTEKWTRVKTDASGAPMIDTKRRVLAQRLWDALKKDRGVVELRNSLLLTAAQGTKPPPPQAAPTLESQTSNLSRNSFLSVRAAAVQLVNQKSGTVRVEPVERAPSAVAQAASAETVSIKFNQLARPVLGEAEPEVVAPLNSASVKEYTLKIDDADLDARINSYIGDVN